VGWYYYSLYCTYVSEWLSCVLMKGEVFETEEDTETVKVEVGWSLGTRVWMRGIRAAQGVLAGDVKMRWFDIVCVGDVKPKSLES